MVPLLSSAAACAHAELPDRAGAGRLPGAPAAPGVVSCPDPGAAAVSGRAHQRMAPARLPLSAGLPPPGGQLHPRPDLLPGDALERGHDRREHRHPLSQVPRGQQPPLRLAAGSAVRAGLCALPAELCQRPRSLQDPGDVLRDLRRHLRVLHPDRSDPLQHQLRQLLFLLDDLRPDHRRKRRYRLLLRGIANPDAGAAAAGAGRRGVSGRGHAPALPSAAGRTAVLDGQRGGDQPRSQAAVGNRRAADGGQRAGARGECAAAPAGEAGGAEPALRRHAPHREAPIAAHRRAAGWS